MAAEAPAAELPENVRKLAPDEELKVGQKFYYHRRESIALGRYVHVKITCLVIGKYIFTEPDAAIIEPGQILYFLYELDPGNRFFFMLSPSHDRSKLEKIYSYGFATIGELDVFIDKSPFDMKDYIHLLIDTFNITEEDRKKIEEYFYNNTYNFNFDVLRYKYVRSIDAEIGHLYFLKGVSYDDLKLIKVVSKKSDRGDSSFLIEYTLPFSRNPDKIYSNIIGNTEKPSIVGYKLFKLPSLEDIRNAAWRRRSHIVHDYYSIRRPRPKNNKANESKTRRRRRHRK